MQQIHQCSTGTEKFPFFDIPTNACICHKFPKLANHLISVGQLCDSNMFVAFDAHYCYVYNQSNGNEVIRGYRHPLSKLYMIPLYQDLNQVPRVTPQTVPRVDSPVMFSAYEVQSVKSLINFLHKSCLSLPISVCLKAVQRNYLATFLGLSEKRIQRYCTKKLQTALGHMQLIPSNVRST